MLLQYGANSNVVANNKNDKVRCQICRPSPVPDATAAIIHQVLRLGGFVLSPLEEAWSKVSVDALKLDEKIPAVQTACVNTQYENNDAKEFTLLGKKFDWCADVSFHGLYSNNNLIEGNDVDTIKIADFYGPSPSNVIFGNRIKARSLGIVVDRASTHTTIVDNLFMDGGISFFDDASSAVCIENKQCILQGASCVIKQQPEFHDIDFGKSSCEWYTSSGVQYGVDKLALTKLGKEVDLQQKNNQIKDGCAYLNRILGGRRNKDACEAQNDDNYSPRPASLFADTTLKACSDLLPKCFDNMRRPAPRLSCSSQGLDLELEEGVDVDNIDFDDNDSYLEDEFSV